MTGCDWLAALGSFLPVAAAAASATRGPAEMFAGFAVPVERSGLACSAASVGD